MSNVRVVGLESGSAYNSCCKIYLVLIIQVIPGGKRMAYMIDAIPPEDRLYSHCLSRALGWDDRLGTTLNLGWKICGVDAKDGRLGRVLVVSGSRGL